MTLNQRADQNYVSSTREISSSIDRMMAILLIMEWVGVVLVALIRSPFTWDGAVRHLHPHLISAFLSGPLFILPVGATAFLFQGRTFTRHLVAIAQMLVSVVLIDGTGGRIESHFFIFGSLAFLAAYRDWRVLMTASLVTGLDHFVRGIWWPMSVYGELTSSPWRFLEHVWWVAFEDLFLILNIRRSVAEMREVSWAKASLYEGANHDVLTGLGNRRLLAERWDQSVQIDPSGAKALLFIDLDRFKQVNDIHGHSTGDRLLSQVAERLTSCFADSAVLARIGGDEFVVLLEGSGPEAATKAGSVALELLNQQFLVDGLDLLLSATVGVALYPEHGATLALLQEKADKAMYSAKAKGRNQVNVFSLEEEKGSDAAHELASDLFQALEKGEFQLEFQPIVERAGKVSSFEALLRWHHPRQGLISPSDFIHLAERSGMIVSIGKWVMLEACRQCRLWQQTPSPPVSVAVNISAVQLQQDDFAAQVESALRDANLHPSLLTLELTESMLIHDFSQARIHLKRLRALGVRIALDDFGTGYSSLTYLAELPVDAVKLDRAFIQNQLKEASTILQSVVEMAHKSHLCVVAEGVEHDSEAGRLRLLGCDQLQGYEFSRPMGALLVPNYLAFHLEEVPKNSLEPNRGLVGLTA